MKKEKLISKHTFKSCNCIFVGETNTGERRAGQSAKVIKRNIIEEKKIEEM
jgi:hypothetical protein